ncbi:MAG: hypothetical protein WCG52_10900 [bacterium]
MSDLNTKVPTGARRPPPPPPEAFESSTESTSRPADHSSIDKFSRLHLGQNGIDANSFLWVMRLDSVNLVIGRELDSGHIAELPGGNICLYRYNPKDGFQMAVLQRENIETSLENHGGCMKLVVRVSDDPAVNSCSVILDAKTVETAFGPWLDFWRPCIFAANPDLVAETIFVGRVRKTEPRENELGIKDAVNIAPALVAIGGGFLFVLSAHEKMRAQKRIH